MLIKCPECGKEISDQASSCPNCGCPISISNNQQPHHTKEPKRGGCLKTIFIFFVICIGAIIAVIYSKKQLDGTQSKKEPDEIQSKKEFEKCFFMFSSLKTQSSYVMEDNEMSYFSKKCVVKLGAIRQKYLEMEQMNISKLVKIT